MTPVRMNTHPSSSSGRTQPSPGDRCLMGPPLMSRSKQPWPHRQTRYRWCGLAGFTFDAGFAIDDRTLERDQPFVVVDIGPLQRRAHPAAPVAIASRMMTAILGRPPR